MSKQQELATLVENYSQVGPTLLKESLLELIQEKGWEGVEIKGWTPYFNDGDPCDFSVYECKPILSTTENDEEDEEDNEIDYESDYWNKDIAAIINLDQNLLLQLFKNEGKMRLYKNGETEVEEVYHD